MHAPTSAAVAAPKAASMAAPASTAVTAAPASTAVSSAPATTVSAASSVTAAVTSTPHKGTFCGTTMRHASISLFSLLYLFPNSLSISIQRNPIFS